MADIVIQFESETDKAERHKAALAELLNPVAAPGDLYLTPEEQEIALAAGALSDEEIAALTGDELQLSRECGDNV